MASELCDTEQERLFVHLAPDEVVWPNSGSMTLVLPDCTSPLLCGENTSLSSETRRLDRAKLPVTAAESPCSRPI